MRLPVIQRADSAADSGIALADRSYALTYLKILVGPPALLAGLSAGRS